jgi:phosphoglucosamine mutase
MKKQYFGTDGIRGRVGEYPITPDFVMKLGWAVGKVLATDHHINHVIIGKDTRISGYMFESALEAGLSAAGVDIHLLGPMPTPAVAYLTRTFRALCGIEISASHNPFHDNGIKFFGTDGFKLPDALELAIEAQLKEPLSTVPSHQLGKASRISDAAGRYIEYCKSTLPAQFNLDGLKVVVDCANGATYKIAPSVLRELGADVIVMGARPDGLNINQLCGSTDTAHLAKTVKANGADVGIALDGDGDRVVMIDALGQVVDGDEILFIMVNNLLCQNRFSGGVVGTVMSNMGLENSLVKLGIPFHRANVGDRYVIEALRQQNWILGGESSGHLVCLNISTTGDGMIAALQVLQAMILQDKSLQDLAAAMHKWPQCLINVASTQPRVTVQDKKIQQVLNEVTQRLQGTGRVLLRPSGTEPVVRIMVEGEDKCVIDQFAEMIADIVRKTAHAT